MSGFRRVKAGVAINSGEMRRLEQAVMLCFKTDPHRLRSNSRSRRDVRPRQIAMYLAYELTTMSLPAIGRFFGGRHHTTVLHARNKIEELLADKDEYVVKKIAAVRIIFQALPDPRKRMRAAVAAAMLSGDIKGKSPVYGGLNEAALATAH